MRNHFRSAAVLTAGLGTLLLGGCIPGGVSQQGIQPEITEAGNIARPAAEPQVVGSDAPVWDSRSVSPRAADVIGTVYVVQPGDTLRGIGNRTGAGSEAIAAANALSPPYMLQPGQQLTIPGGRYHAVSQGETGIAIAHAYGVAWSDIVELNALAEPYILRIGQRLKLPAAAAAMAAAPSAVGPAVATNANPSRIGALVVNIDDVVTGSQPAIAEGTAVPAARSARAPVSAAVPVSVPRAFAGRFAWPITGSVLTRYGPVGKGQISNGIDISAPRGSPFRAAADGVVSYAGSEVAIYGGLILISHGDGWVSAYGHAERIDVTRGQAVKAGQVLGAAGQSGFAETPKLHFELRKDRKPVDPLLYLPKS
ncbi:M23 family metallopeptidase [Blastomonas sp.]|uniref:M23 family metallopeptidase n=1 Tax=Blastomonas sp. TaxID=1909299 RepID=UPI00260171E3|nr:M23 family metallopeptidase [Blastomonas sp.]MDM7955434.1 M23 family metallopeptidase [Blastomonas sp.]